MRGREERVGFAISPTDYKEAQRATDGLFAYCKHFYGEETAQWLTVTEQRLREHDVWDPATRGVTRAVQYEDD